MIGSMILREAREAWGGMSLDAETVIQIYSNRGKRVDAGGPRDANMKQARYALLFYI